MPNALTEQPPLDQCEFHAIRSLELSVSDILAYFREIRDYVKHEDGLINSRLTWSLTIHAFLFAAYGIMLGKAVDVLVELHKGSLPTSTPTVLVGAIVALLLLQIPVAWLGAVVAYHSGNAICAAHNAIQHLNAIAHTQGLKIAPGTTEPNVRRYYVTDVRKGTVCRSFGIPRDALLLPRVISGGDRGQHTAGARDYYLVLPKWIMRVWIVLGLGSLLFAAVTVGTIVISPSLLAPPLPSPTANSRLPNRP